ncbi:MAG: DUF4198 domain-containing protein [Deltaproteobacteria bacterium]
MITNPLSRLTFRFITFALVSVCIFLDPDRADAHNMTIRSIPDRKAVVLKGVYSDGEPASGAEFVIRRGDEGKIFQKGYADINGVFAFCPTGDGPWIVSLDDHMGHKTTQRIQTEPGPAVSPRPTNDTKDASSSRFLPAITGVSILFGLWGLWQVSRR